ncbi:MAG: hypothetical protein MJE77_32940 [Proteobacteria bacterium]|nr:hypothetical protein [Pseudomonadota bacterium]
MVRTSTIFFVCGAMLLAAGCGTSRVVRQTQTGGEIALQGDRNEAMKDAHAQMQAHCQGPYTIVEQGEVVVGTDTIHSDESYVAEDGTVVNEGGEHTRQATEWRIKYVCGNASAPPPGPGTVPPTPPPPSSQAPPPPPPGN